MQKLGATLSKGAHGISEERRPKATASFTSPNIHHWPQVLFRNLCFRNALIVFFAMRCDIFSQPSRGFIARLSKCKLFLITAVAVFRSKPSGKYLWFLFPDIYDLSRT